MIYREHDDAVAFMEEMNRVGKALHDRAANGTAHGAKNQRNRRYPRQHLIHRIFEFQSEPGAFTFIPDYRFVVFTPGDFSEDDLPAHCFRPYFDSVAPLISLHGTTSLGFAR